MKSLWNDTEAEKLNNDPLKLRVYSSRLLGQEEDLVLHGGGNTSVKTREKNVYGEEEDIIYVKGSGWDLATIEDAGFAPVKLEELKKMAKLDDLNDVDMVRYQRMAMTNPSAPNPSVEAILHAITPFAFVDHTHADAVVAISNTPNGEEKIRQIYGDSILVIPYVMPGFILAKAIYDLTKDVDWTKVEGMILLNHGVFTFNDDAKKSYEDMINLVSKAENYLNENTGNGQAEQEGSKVNPLRIAQLRQQVSALRSKATLVHFDDSVQSVAYSNLSNLSDIAGKGPLTPDHIIRTKRTPLIWTDDTSLGNYSKDYQKYFETHNKEDLVMLDTAPRWAVWPGYGTLSMDSSMKGANIIKDISQHTMKAITEAEQMGGWVPLPESDLFEMEYWVLEQEKLKKGGSAKGMQGKIALVTGAASGIGKACVDALVKQGAAVIALDINPSVETCFENVNILGIPCDVTSSEQLQNAIEKGVKHFGGLDMLVSNAGIFPDSHSIGEMDGDVWQKSLDINLTSHQKLLQLCKPYLELGMDASIVIMASKNVHAPGPGASAYSVAKAGLTQLGRIAALEFGEKNIRVNMLHPNAVFDTGVWTDEVLVTRAKNYGLSVEEYKANNVLHTEVTSIHVADMVVAMLGPVFSKTTGAQIPIDGGNERVI